MKLNSPISLAFVLLGQSFACVRFEGQITNAGALSGLNGISATVTDNGLRVCDGGSRIDQDGHYSLSCLPGYMFAVTKNAATSWYNNNGGGAWQIDLHRSSSTDCCGGEGKNGGCAFSCTYYHWDTSYFC
ncbi:hypothetical protein DL98DRAFT_595714 [Cadophora sp. DSE1049]|nr:hypothetical protein DL98DRAFT_595714 [Cadophora sp. DSE1049]